MAKQNEITLKDAKVLFEDLGSLESLIKGKTFEEVYNLMQKDYDIIRREKEVITDKLVYEYFDVNYKSLSVTINKDAKGLATITNMLDFYPRDENGKEYNSPTEIWLNGAFKLKSDIIVGNLFTLA